MMIRPILQPGIDKGGQIIKPTMPTPRVGSTIRKSTGGMIAPGSQELMRNVANTRRDLRQRAFDLEDDQRQYDRGAEEREFNRKKRKQFFKLAKREEADWEEKKINLKQERLLKAQEQYSNLLDAEARSADNTEFIKEVDIIRGELGRERATFDKNLTTGVISMIAEVIDNEVDDEAINQLQTIADGMFPNQNVDIEDLSQDQLGQLANKVALLAKGSDSMDAIGTFTGRVKTFFDSQIDRQKEINKQLLYYNQLREKLQSTRKSSEAVNGLKEALGRRIKTLGGNLDAFAARTGEQTEVEKLMEGMGLPSEGEEGDDIDALAGEDTGENEDIGELIDEDDKKVESARFGKEEERSLTGSALANIKEIGGNIAQAYENAGGTEELLNQTKQFIENNPGATSGAATALAMAAKPTGEAIVRGGKALLPKSVEGQLNTDQKALVSEADKVGKQQFLDQDGNVGPKKGGKGLTPVKKTLSVDQVNGVNKLLNDYKLEPFTEAEPKTTGSASKDLKAKIEHQIKLRDHLNGQIKKRRSVIAAKLKSMKKKYDSAKQTKIGSLLNKLMIVGAVAEGANIIYDLYDAFKGDDPELDAMIEEDKLMVSTSADLSANIDTQIDELEKGVSQ
jgi:hypothetical protein